MRLTALIVIVFLFSTGAAHAIEKTWDREELLKAGAVGQLLRPEERAQFHLLVCQPRRAWRAAQEITDTRLRRLFEGVILSFSSIERPPAPRNERNLMEVQNEGIEFPLDQSELWQDEVEDVQVRSDCDSFPLAEISIRSALSEQARERLQDEEAMAEVADRFQLLALATDLGLRPTMTEEELEKFDSINPQSPYLRRFRSMIEPPNINQEKQINIKGLRASISSPLQMFEMTLTPHALEIPWLLQ